MSGSSPWSAAWSLMFGGGWTSLPTTFATSATISGLRPGTAYDIRVVAIGPAGAAPSAPITATT